MRTITKLWILGLLGALLVGCNSSQTPKTVAQALLKHYQTGQFKSVTGLFLPQSEAYRVAEIVGAPKDFLKIKGVEGETNYQARIMDILKAKRNGFKIHWAQTKFEKIIVKSTKKHLESLETQEVLLLFKGKTLFQQPIKLVKFKGNTYLWEVGEFDRFRASKSTKA